MSAAYSLCVGLYYVLRTSSRQRQFDAGYSRQHAERAKACNKQYIDCTTSNMHCFLLNEHRFQSRQHNPSALFR
jgi:hypothetical protein